jgi:hypothetical protein
MAGTRRGYQPGDAGWLELKRMEMRVKQHLGQESNPTLQGVLLWIHGELGRSVEASDWAASERHVARLQRMLSEGRRWLSRQP